MRSALASLLLITACTAASAPDAGFVCPLSNGTVPDGWQFDFTDAICIPRFDALTVNGASVTLPALPGSEQVIDLPDGLDSVSVVATTTAPGVTVVIDDLETTQLTVQHSAPAAYVVVGLRFDGSFLRLVHLTLRWGPRYAAASLGVDSGELGGSVAISGDGNVLVSALPALGPGSTCSDAHLSVLESDGGAYVRHELPLGDGCVPWSVAASASGSLIAIGNSGSSEPVQLFSRVGAEWTPLTVSMPFGAASQVAVIPDGSAVWASWSGGLGVDGGATSRLCRIAAGDAGFSITHALPFASAQFAVSADESTLALGTFTSVDIYSADAGTWSLAERLPPPPEHPKHHDFGSSVALSDDGAVLVASARETAVAYVYERTGGGYQLRSTLAPVGQWMHSNAVIPEVPVSVSPDGAQVVVGFPFGGVDPVIASRDGGTWRVAEVLPRVRDSLAPSFLFGNGVALSRDGRSVLVGSPLGSPALVLFRAR